MEQHWALKPQPSPPAKQTQNPLRHAPEQQSSCVTHACAAALQGTVVVLVVTVMVLVVLPAGTVVVVVVVLLAEGASVVLLATGSVRVVVVGGGSHVVSPCLRQLRTIAARQCFRARAFGWLVSQSARSLLHARTHARRGLAFPVRGAAAKRREATAMSVRAPNPPEHVREERWTRATLWPYRNSVMDGKDDEPHGQGSIPELAVKIRQIGGRVQRVCASQAIRPVRLPAHRPSRSELSHLALITRIPAWPTGARQSR